MSPSTGLRAASRSSSPECGFTLIEVVIAFAIAALILVMLSQALGVGIAGTSRATSSEEATILAQSALDPIGVIAPLRDGDTADLDRDGYHVHVDVSRFADPSAPHTEGYLKLFRLSATVAWRGRLAAHTLTLTTLRLGPEGRPAQ